MLNREVELISLYPTPTPPTPTPLPRPIVSVDVKRQWFKKKAIEVIQSYHSTVFGSNHRQLAESNNNNNNNLFYIAPQQQLYELLALYRSRNAIEHTSACYLN